MASPDSPVLAPPYEVVFQHGIGITTVTSAATGRMATIVARTRDFPEDYSMAFRITQSINLQGYTVSSHARPEDEGSEPGIEETLRRVQMAIDGHDQSAMPERGDIERRRTFRVTATEPLDKDAMFAWLDKRDS